MTTTTKKASTVLREAYNREGKPILGISPPTPSGGKLLEAAGFEYLFIGGNTTVEPMFDVNGTGELDMSTWIFLAKTFVRAVNIPVVMDIDVGFGGPSMVEKVVREYIAIGIAGIRMEDGIVRFLREKPQGMFHDEVTTIDDMVLKIEAANIARNELDPDFVIVVRSDCHLAEGYRGLDEVIERGKAYKAAGADVLFTSAARGEDRKAQLKTIIEGVAPMPVGILGQGLDLEDAAELGLKEIRYPSELVRGMHASGWDYMLDIKQRGFQAIKEFRERNQDNPYKEVG